MAKSLTQFELHDITYFDQHLTCFFFFLTHTRQLPDVIGFATLNHIIKHGELQRMEFWIHLGSIIEMLTGILRIFLSEIPGWLVPSKGIVVYHLHTIWLLVKFKETPIYLVIFRRWKRQVQDLIGRNGKSVPAAVNLRPGIGLFNKRNNPLQNVAQFHTFTEHSLDLRLGKVAIK